MSTKVDTGGRRPTVAYKCVDTRVATQHHDVCPDRQKVLCLKGIWKKLFRFKELIFFIVDDCFKVC